MNKKTAVWSGVYFILLAAAAAVYIVVNTDALKAVASSVFAVGGIINLVIALRCKAKGYPASKYLLVVAAIFCLAGDIGLCYNFIAGMALFAVGHIAYIAAFRTINMVGWRTVGTSALLIVGALLWLLLWPAYDFGDLTPAIIIYAVVICCMLGSAIGVALDGAVNKKLRFCIYLGASLFYISDLFLTIRMFAGGGRGYSVACLVTYYLAQYLLTMCVLLSAQSGESRVKPRMNVFKRLFCRAYQAVFYLALPLLPYRQPKPLGGSGEAAELLSSKGKRKALIVTDSTVYKLGLCDNLVSTLRNQGIDCAIYSDTVANPTVSNVTAAADLFRKEGCDCLIAVGGGSAMDCAKAAGALIIKPKKSIYKMRGVLKVFGKLPLFIAVPTTAGTGSETTIAAVITDDKTRDKFTIISFCLAPHYAILDPAMTIGLPPSVTATTGMDALTHAVEAYIGRSTTRMTRRLAVEAVSIIRANLLTAYTDGKNQYARRRMQYAAYCAGLAFTISYVGYVHAVAHSLGGKYNTPHGLANAVILPYVLKRYGVSARKRLAMLSRKSGVSDAMTDDQTAAEQFIAFVEELNAKMNIPAKLRVEEGDIAELSRHADKEANPLYPVPALMDAKHIQAIYNDIKE